MDIRFAKELQSARQEVKLTQKALAERAGTYESHISALENGSKACGLNMAKRLALALYPDNESKRMILLMHLSGCRRLNSDEAFLHESFGTALSVALSNWLRRQDIAMEDVKDVIPNAKQDFLSDDLDDKDFDFSIELMDGNREFIKFSRPE